MSVAQARAVVTRDSASFHEQVRAVGTLAADDDEATVADLLMCLRCREVAARLAACALYRRTGRTPVPDQPFDYSIDLDDWATYVAARPETLGAPPRAGIETRPTVLAPAGTNGDPAVTLRGAPERDVAPAPATVAEAPVTAAEDSSRELRRATWRRPLAIALGIGAIGLGCAALALQWPFTVTVSLGVAGNVLLAVALLTSRRATTPAA